MSARFRHHVWFVAALLALSAVAAHAAARQLPLIEAVRNGEIAAVRALLPQVDVNAAQDDGTTAMHWAVHLDNLTMADLLIKAGARVQVANRYKMTPLALACTNGNASMIELLLKAGADANGTIADGETALMTAARGDRADAAKVLLAHRADVNARETFRGQTALMWAASRGNVAVVKTLLEAGAQVAAKTSDVAPKHSNEEADFLKAEEIGGQTGYLWTATEPSAYSALMFAVRAGHVDVVKALLDGGAGVNEMLSDGTSALVLAVINAHYELAAYLIDRGANVNANEQGWTALHQAVRNRRANTRSYSPPVATGRMELVDLIRKLIADGAQVNARMWKNGLKNGERQRFNYMGATPFLIAAKIGDLDMMRLLLANGADPHITNVEHETALMVAAGVALFNPGEDSGSNPEHMPERLEAITLCVGLGLNVNALSTENETALHGSAYLGDSAIVEYLVAQGARLDVQNDRGWTPLMIANGVAYAEFYKEQPALAVTLRRLMTVRGLATENQIGDQKTCKDCYLTRGKEAFHRIDRDRRLQSDTALVNALKNAQ